MKNVVIRFDSDAYKEYNKLKELIEKGKKKKEKANI